MSLKNKLRRQLGDVITIDKASATEEAPIIESSTSIANPAPETAAPANSKRAALLALQQKLSKIAPTALGDQPLPPANNTGSRHLPEKSVQTAESAFNPTALPGATTVTTDLGSVFYVDNVFPLPYRHGDNLLTTSTAALAELTKNRHEFTNCDLTKTVFFDLETTGLAGGSGTIPFMIGAGKLEGNNFIVRQYFARTPDEEPAMLAHFRSFVGSGPLASFNGQTFDVPLLTTRLIMNRLPADIAEIPHLDLITLSRRLWKTRLKDCSLKNLEEHCMGIHRCDDVDGAEVPQLYLDFINGRPTPLLERVFYHNKIDIITLVALAITQVRQTAECVNGMACPEDLYSYAHFILEDTDPEAALTLYNTAAHGQFLSLENRITNLLALAFLTKKRQGRPAAVCHWQRICELSPRNLTAQIELCKYLEHDLRDYQEALITAKRCRDWPISLKERQELEHRIKRLKMRLDDPAAFVNSDVTAFDP